MMTAWRYPLTIRSLSSRGNLFTAESKLPTIRRSGVAFIYAIQSGLEVYAGL